MINIQSVMLVALGFLVAALITLLVAPAYRRRAERLATEAIKRSMPLTEAEIRADRDRLRAEYAIAIHRLEMKVSEANVSAARQRIELNRRDAAISDLEGSVSSLTTQLEEHENARRVLEQTLTDRLPRIETRLTDAKKMLMQRDREITALTQTTGQQTRALEEATQINTQQRTELERLNAALATRAARNTDSTADDRHDSEVVLRSEIEALRAKNRDQAAHIVRLQGLISRRSVSADDLGDLEARSAALSGMPAPQPAPADDVERLRVALRESEAALKAAQAASQTGRGGGLDTELRALRASNEDQSMEIARLKAAISSYQADQGDDAKDSRLAMKAQVTSLKVQVEEQAATIQRLRAEIATANELLSRQAQNFRDELRRMGVGTVPAAPAADVMRNPAETTAGRRSLAARISEPRTTRAEAAPGDALSNTADPAAHAAPVQAPKVVEAANGGEPGSAVEMAPSHGKSAIPFAIPPAASSAAATPAGSAASGPGAAAAAVQAPSPAPVKSVEAPRRPRLMERLAGSDSKSSA